MTHSESLTHSETLAETMLLTRGTKPRRLRLRFVALVTAIAVALGTLGTAAPARADNDDLVKALAALAVVGIIAHGMNQKKRHETPAYAPPKPKPAPKPPLVRGPLVPGVCAFVVPELRSTVYGENCLRDEGFAWGLPQACARPARIYGQPDRLFTAKCLRDAGFRIGGAPY